MTRISLRRPALRKSEGSDARPSTMEREGRAGAWGCRVQPWPRRDPARERRDCKAIVEGIGKEEILPWMPPTIRRGQ